MIKNKKSISIIDYGVGNILSLKNSLEYLGASVLLTNKREEILQSTHIILPGVGAFSNAMNLVNELKLKDILYTASKKNIYLLGICLGMQLLLSESEEFGLTKRLNLIPGKVKSIKNFSKKNLDIKLPHIGWNKIFRSNAYKKEIPILKNLSMDDHFYFVHSYMSVTTDENNHLFSTSYSGINIPAIIGNKNIFGFQFHPEKSSTAGLKLLKNFINL